eukprot:994142-Amphidinium_carterae.2
MLSALSGKASFVKIMLDIIIARVHASLYRPGARWRVANHTSTMVEREPIIFDDSFEHEVVLLEHRPIPCKSTSACLVSKC